MHIENKQFSYTQNIDGIVHDEKSNSDGAPLDSVKKEILISITRIGIKKLRTLKINQECLRISKAVDGE